MRFIPDPHYPGQSVNDTDVAVEGPSEAEQLSIAFAILSAHTATHEDCYFCVRNRWSTIRPADGAPSYGYPTRDYVLFHGTTTDIAYWKTQQQNSIRHRYGVLPDPAFAWPADHAWCIANDVDPH